jgi:hypothetical protein
MLVHGKRVKIFYFSNTFKSINWGSQATSAGMRHWSVPLWNWTTAIKLGKSLPNELFSPF